MFFNTFHQKKELLVNRLDELEYNYINKAIKLPYKEEIEELRNNKVATKCRACGAPATGYKGQVIKCQYCDTDNQL